MINPRQLINQLRVGYFMPVVPVNTTPAILSPNYARPSRCLPCYQRSPSEPIVNYHCLPRGFVPFAPCAAVGGVYDNSNPSIYNRQNFGACDNDFNCCSGDLKVIHKITLMSNPSSTYGHFFNANQYYPLSDDTSYDNQFTSRFKWRLFI